MQGDPLSPFTFMHILLLKHYFSFDEESVMQGNSLSRLLSIVSHSCHDVALYLKMYVTLMTCLQNFHLNVCHNFLVLLLIVNTSMLPSNIDLKDHVFRLIYSFPARFTNLTQRYHIQISI